MIEKTGVGHGVVDLRGWLVIQGNRMKNQRGFEGDAAQGCFASDRIKGKPVDAGNLAVLDVNAGGIEDLGGNCDGQQQHQVVLLGRVENVEGRKASGEVANQAISRRDGSRVFPCYNAGGLTTLVKLGGSAVLFLDGLDTELVPKNFDDDAQSLLGISWKSLREDVFLAIALDRSVFEPDPGGKLAERAVLEELFPGQVGSVRATQVKDLMNRLFALSYGHLVIDFYLRAAKKREKRILLGVVSLASTKSFR